MATTKSRKMQNILFSISMLIIAFISAYLDGHFYINSSKAEHKLIKAINAKPFFNENNYSLKGRDITSTVTEILTPKLSQDKTLRILKLAGFKVSNSIWTEITIKEKTGKTVQAYRADRVVHQFPFFISMMKCTIFIEFSEGKTSHINAYII